jgi:CheY-like chemotaxis protein/HPt (histidine-containing phosphotransfer) domain-containing protein
LRQVLFNLAGNAVKFSGTEAGKAGKVVIRADLVEADANNIRVCLQVTDNGIGMSAESVERLFQPFTQAESSTTRRFGGTGLGLSICLRLTQLMGGTIEVQSAPGVGSTFRVALEFEVMQGAGATDRPFDLHNLSVVMLAPGEDMREILVRYLDDSGAQVLQAQHADDAVQQASTAKRMGRPFVVVLADSGGEESVAAALRHRFLEASDLAGTRFVMIHRGRRRTARTQGSDSVVIDANAMRRAALLRAVAVAAGRASPERVVEEPVRRVSPSRLPSIQEAQAAGRLILVAEDNKTNQKVIERQLHLLGYAVEMADDGQEALLMWRSKRYGLVLSDCHMPHMDGFELASALRQEEGDSGRHTPIIAITANALKGEDERCLAAGMDDYLAKPIQLVALRDTLAKWLAPPATPPESAVGAEPRTEGVFPPQSGPAAAVNPDALKEVVGDDPALVAELLGDFLVTAREAIGEIQAAFDNRCAKDLGAVAHKLKSSARTVGADALADLCQELEQAGKVDDWTAIDISMPRLASCFAAVEQFIGVFVTREG